MLEGLLVVVYNRIILEPLLSSVIEKLRFSSKNDQEIELMLNTAMHQIVNFEFFAFFAPLLIEIPDIKKGVENLSLPDKMLIAFIVQTLFDPVK